MAVLPDYVTGTITLANGSTTVTGTGTMFTTAAFRPGDTLQIQNLTAIIASVNSNTSLTLTAPWTGTSLTNALYRARYLPDGARVTAQTTTLIELLGNGNLQALAGLTGAANKGIMFTGAGTAGTFDLTAITLTILGRTTGADIYGDLGVVPVAQVPSTLGRDKAYRQGNILGTVSQSGGVPTGALIEVGNNSNGAYIRFADGTQICRSPNLAMGPVDTQTGSFYRTARYTWAFPAAFLASTIVVQANDTVSSDLWSGCTTNSGDTAAVINLNYYQSLATARTAKAIAIGRWF